MALGVGTAVAIAAQLVVPVVVEFAVVIHIAVVAEKLERHCCDVAAVAVDAKLLVELHVGRVGVGLLPVVGLLVVAVFVKLPVLLVGRLELLPQRRIWTCKHR